MTLIARLSAFVETWDPDCERSDAFANLNQFARDYPVLVARLCSLIGADTRTFGKTFYRHLHRMILRYDAEAILELMAEMEPLLVERGSLPSREFWGALCADAAELTRLRQLDGRLRSCWGVTPIVNMRSGVKADRMLGIEAESLVFTHYHTSSDFDVVLKDLQERILAEPHAPLFPFRWLVLGWALLRYDAFHLYNDAGILEPAGGYGARMGIPIDEMRLYRRAGKLLYTYAYGADHRMRKKASAAGRWTFCSECPDPGAFCICDDAGGEQMLATIRAHATATVAHGLSMALIPGARNIAYTAIDFDEIEAVPSRAVGEGALRVGHFPNHPHFKGTHYLERAVAQLRAEGVDIELVLLSGLQQTEVIEVMKGLDVLVDQLLSGAFGLTAIEGMALELPVIAYLHDNVALADLANCPVIEANPETIEAVLRRLALKRGELIAAGRQARVYVARNYSVPALAVQLAELYRDTAGLAPALSRRVQRHAVDAESEIAGWSRAKRRQGRLWMTPHLAKAGARMASFLVRKSFEQITEVVKPKLIAFEEWSGLSLKYPLNIVRYIYGIASFLVRKSLEQLTEFVKPKLIAFEEWSGLSLKYPLNNVRYIYSIASFLVRKSLGQLTEVVKPKLIAFEEWSGLSLKYPLNNVRCIYGLTKKHFIVQPLAALSLHVTRFLVATSWYLRTRRHARGAKVRTLWGTTPILTLPVLARCDKLLGLGSDSLVFTTYHITKNFSINLTIPEKFAVKAMRLNNNIHRWFRSVVLYFVMIRYDAVHYFYDRGVMPGHERFGIEDFEIETLSRAGVKIYTYAYGADVRTRESTLALGPVNFCTDCPTPGAFCICDEDKLALSLSRLDNRVTARIAMGDMLTYVPGCRNMHYWPLDLDHLKPGPVNWRKGDRLRIAHAPNHSHFKGTHHLEQALERLKGEGYDVEMIKISGVPNTVVLDMFRTVDLVADQFIGGFHGYTALEAMALGRPVLCFLRAPDMTIAPDECPIVNTPPHLVYEVLKAILDGQIDLADLGRRSRLFIERHYSLAAVAARLGHLYLETSAWPQATLDKIAARVSALEATLPAPILAEPPVAWKRVHEIPGPNPASKRGAFDAPAPDSRQAAASGEASAAKHPAAKHPAAMHPAG